MSTNNLVLNKLFTLNVFRNLIAKRSNSIYGTIVKRYIDDVESKDNGLLISEIYKHMSKSYRNEYVYQNTLLNKLLLGRHSINTTTALTQVPIVKSKADFILINGKAVVYEIKTELDSFDRLEMQVKDYYKAFNHVFVVTSESNYGKLCSILKDCPTGIYVLTNRNTFSLRKEAMEQNQFLDYTAIFKILRKKEFENIIETYYGELPKVAQVFYYGECFKWFKRIPLMDAYIMFLKELKKRNKIIIEQFQSVPYELKSLMYFSNSSLKDYYALDQFLNEKFGG